MTRAADIPRVGSYTGACHLLRERDSRVIGNNTRLVRLSDMAIAVRLHATDIVVFYRDHAGTGRNQITLDTGGWRTRVTLQRMNAVLPDGAQVLASNWRGHRFTTWRWSAPGRMHDGLRLIDGTLIDDAGGG